MSAQSLHAAWWNSSLYVWGTALEDPTEISPSGQALNQASPMHAVAADVVRRTMGDVWEPLIASEATEDWLQIRLPAHVAHPSTTPPRDTEHSKQIHDDDPNEAASAAPGRLTPPAVATLRKPQTVAAGGRDLPRAPQGAVDGTLLRLPCLVFGPVDAVDLLASAPADDVGNLTLGDTFRFWSHLSYLVLELLARQRFIPTAYEGPDGAYYGLWRALASDNDTAQRLQQLTVHMPPVCRNIEADHGMIEASLLIEDFVSMTVDGLVRQCLESDELTLAILDRQAESSSKETWLRALVSADGRFLGSNEHVRSTYESVRSWVSGAEPGAAAPDVQLCIRLDEMTSGLGAGDGATTTARWRIRLFAQTGQSQDMIPAEQLWDASAGSPTLMRASLASVRNRIASELQRVARYFEPLATLSPETGLAACEVATSEAYVFLRDAAPLLEAEGVAVMLPDWWQEDRPRLHLVLNVHPESDRENGGVSVIGLDSIVSYDWRLALGDVEITSSELSNLVSANEPLVRIRGKWLEVRPSDIERAEQFAVQRAGGRMTLMECIRMCYFAEHSDSGLPVQGIQASGWIARLLDAAPEPIPEDAMTAPTEFHGRLRPYQLRGLRWLAFLNRIGLGGCLADDMGLGKTIQLIALLLHERQMSDQIGPTLLVVPMSLVGNWQREIERFAPSLDVMVHHGLDRLTGKAFVEQVGDYDVVISTYGLAHRDFDHLGAIRWHRIALDEAQNIKNPMAKQSVAVRALHSERRVALTGTPVENRLSELWSIIDFLNPGYLGGAKEFRRRFAIPIERHHDPERTEQLRALIRPFVLRRLKSDADVIKDLPEKLEIRVFCNLTAEQAALYQALVDDMLARIDRAEGIQRRGLILATLTKLKQVCNHPTQYLRDGSNELHRSGKCARLIEMLEEVIAEQDRALVFTQFREMGGLLAALIQRHLSVQPYFLHGGTSQRERDEMTHRFQENEQSPSIFVLSLKAGGYGLNLSAANHVFHFDRWWNPAVEDQASDRAHRIGQKRTVQVHKFVCIGTVEDRIDKMIEQKRAIANRIVGGGEDWLTELSTAQLRDVFELSRDAIAEG